MSANKLFYVRYQDHDYCPVENMDQLVVAPDEATAIQAWRDIREYDTDVKPDSVGVVPGVTPTSSVGAIDWGDIFPD